MRARVRACVRGRARTPAHLPVCLYKYNIRVYARAFSRRRISQLQPARGYVPVLTTEEESNSDTGWPIARPAEANSVDGGPLVTRSWRPSGNRIKTADPHAEATRGRAPGEGGGCGNQ